MTKTRAKYVADHKGYNKEIARQAILNTPGVREVAEGPDYIRIEADDPNIAAEYYNTYADMMDQAMKTARIKIVRRGREGQSFIYYAVQRLGDGMYVCRQALLIWTPDIGDAALYDYVSEAIAAAQAHDLETILLNEIEKGVVTNA